MKRAISLITLILVGLTLLVTGCSSKEETTAVEEKSFNYYTAEEVKESIEQGKDMLLVDIQVEEEYNEHHIKSTIATYAFPVKTDEDKAKLDNVLSQIKDSKDPIVIVCPRGGGGAERTYKYLLDKGIKEDRLNILENGQTGWPYDELLEK